MSDKVFISYRRSDAEAYAGRIFDNLAAKISPERIFLDVDKIGIGKDFIQEIGSAIAASGVFLAIIGPTWLSSVNPDGQKRLWLEDDPVRLEIETALRQAKYIIPVLCGRAEMPGAADLPPPLRPLCTRNAVRLSNERFRQDMLELEAAIDLALAEARDSKAETGDAERPRAWASQLAPKLQQSAPNATALGARVAAASVGGYRFEDVAQYEGKFLMLRNDFMEREQIHRYAMDICWDVAANLLVIRHRGIASSGYKQFGVLSFTRNERYLSIEAGDQGWRQLVLLEQMDFRRTMYGALFTIGNVSRRSFMPTVAPVALLGYAGEDRETRRVMPNDADYGAYAEHLRQAKEDCLTVI